MLPKYRRSKAAALRGTRIAFKPGDIITPDPTQLADLHRLFIWGVRYTVEHVPLTEITANPEVDSYFDFLANPHIEIPKRIDGFPKAGHMFAIRASRMLRPGDEDTPYVRLEGRYALNEFCTSGEPEYNAAMRLAEVIDAQRDALREARDLRKEIGNFRDERNRADASYESMIIADTRAEEMRVDVAAYHLLQRTLRVRLKGLTSLSEVVIDRILKPSRIEVDMDSQGLTDMLQYDKIDA